MISVVDRKLSLEQYMIGQDVENLSRISAVRIDCLGSGSKVMTPSGPVLLPPLVRELVGEGASLLVARLLTGDSLGDSSGTESVSVIGSGESYPWMGLGGMGDGSPQRRNSKFAAEGVMMVTSCAVDALCMAPGPMEAKDTLPTRTFHATVLEIAHRM